jgi:predicted ATPase
MAKILVLEGLPRVGKSTLLGNLRNNYKKDKGSFIECIGELVTDPAILESQKNSSQLAFMYNDAVKALLATTSQLDYAIVDRGPLSTLAYNKTLLDMGLCDDETYSILYEECKWVYRNFFENSLHIYMYNDARPTPTVKDDKNPYGTVENLLLLERNTLSLAESLGLHLEKFYNNFLIDNTYEAFIQKYLN